MKFFNTTFALSMAPDGFITTETISEKDAVDFLSGECKNVANPSHLNTLQAITKKLDVDVTTAKGGRVTLEAGDECLVPQIFGLPRETREFSDEEISNAMFEFRIVKILGTIIRCPVCEQPAHTSDFSKEEKERERERERVCCICGKEAVVGDYCGWYCSDHHQEVRDLWSMMVS